MRIAYNPKTSGPLPQAPGNNDITFDLAAKVIYARGTAFDGKAYKTFKKHDYDDDSGGWDGLVPAPSYSTANVRLLREDGQWVHIAGISSPDQELDEESINSVENKVITKKINELTALIGTKAVDVYKNIKVGSTTIVAKGVNDTLEFILGNGIMLVPNNKTISISIDATGDLGIDISYENGQLITKITKNYFDSWNETFDWYKSITDENTNEYIDKWQEIVDFLDELKKTDGNILDLFVTVYTDLVISGKKIFNNFLYLNDTKKYIRHTGGNSGYLEIFNETNVFSGLGLWDNGAVKVYTNSKWHDIIHSGNIGDQSVGTADKLKNKVKIWGQDFDGSSDISGQLSLGNGLIARNDESGTARTVISFTTDSTLFNYGLAEQGYNTYIEGNEIIFRYSTDHKRGMTILSSGNVGIGTANPAYKLDVTGSVYASYSTNNAIHIGTKNDVACVSLYAAKSGNHGVYSSTLSSWLLYTDGTNTIIPFGNVGIGTANPLRKLHVAGVIRTNSQVEAPYFMAGIDVEGLYMSAGGIAWHDANYAYKSTLLEFTSNTVTIQKRTTIHESLSLVSDGAYRFLLIGDPEGIHASVHNAGFRDPRVAALSYYDGSTLKGSLAVDSLPYFVDSNTNFYELLHTGNSYIKNGVITINKVSITPLTAHLSLANYVTLNSAQTISGVKTFSALLKFTVAQGNAPFSVASTTVVTKLNADLLDGIHASDLFTNLSNDTNLLSVTIGGTNKKLTIDYAKAAGVLTSSAGTATNPVYFSDGKPVACTYSLNKTVPANAKFTDTTYSEATTSASGLMSVADKKKLDGITASADAVSFSASLTSGTKVGTININGTDTVLYCHTNTWRGITDSYTGTETTVSLSQKGANNLYKALVNGNADTVDGYHISVGSSAGADDKTIYFVI